MTIDEAWIGESLRPLAGGGRVRTVRDRPGRGLNSEVRHLEIRWEGAPTSAPTAVVWKRGRADDREVEVWKLLRGRDDLPVPRCFAADERGLLLEDLSATHAPAVDRDALLAGRGVPPGDAAGRVVDALADFHAAWWEHPSLGAGVARVRDWFRDRECHERHLERRREELTRFEAAEPAHGELPLCRRALAVLERLWTREWEERVAAGRDFTLVHGDAYLSQFLVPRTGDGPAVLLDFQDATANPGAWDLAFLLATFWTPEQRRGRERRLLGRYRERLATRGVHVDAARLAEDYRRMIAYLLFDAVWNRTDGSSRRYWEPKLACLAAAWRDWDCGGLAIPR